MTDRDWFIATYDDAVAEGSTDVGIELAKVRDLVAHRYADAVEAGAIPAPALDLVETGRGLFDQHVRPARSRRREAIRVDFDHILGYVRGGAAVPGLFAQAYPLGNGSDKTLTYWTPEDLDGAVLERYRNAAAAAEAASRFDEAAAELKQAISTSGGRMLGDLA